MWANTHGAKLFIILLAANQAVLAPKLPYELVEEEETNRRESDATSCVST